MSSRVTQIARAVTVDKGTAAAGGNARVTQIARVVAADIGTPKAGGQARVTQIARAIIATLPQATGPAILTAAVVGAQIRRRKYARLQQQQGGSPQ